MAYTPHDYASMLGDKGRMNAYSAALKRAINPDSVVLDLGTGTGYFAVLSCLLGAKKVYAIEPNPAICIGEQLAADNGVGKQITWFEDYSSNVTLPEQVDIIVSDLRGLLPQNEGNLPAIKDARTRFLKPNGILLPQRDKLWVALASDEEIYKQIKQPWLPIEFPEFDLSSFEAAHSHTYVSREARSANLLSKASLWTEIEYATATTMNHRQQLDFPIKKDGTGHGIYVWFETHIDSESSYSFGPDVPMTVYGCAFFPWKRPLELKQDDRVSIDLAVHLGAEGYDWTWNTTFAPVSPERTGESFQQSTFFAPSSLEKTEIAKRSHRFKPRCKERGSVAIQALSLMNQERTIEEIARILSTEFPSIKKSPEEWINMVASLSQEFAD